MLRAANDKIHGEILEWGESFLFTDYPMCESKETVVRRGGVSR